jgi:molybdenum cofactor cytidylyltransferase
VPKVSLKLSQEISLGSVALSELDRCELSPLVVVVRADDNLEWLPPSNGNRGRRRTETCLTAHLGLSFSLRCGLNAVLPAQPDAVIVALADQPFVTAGLVNQLIETYENSPGLDYVASTHQGAGMPPALFSRALFPALQGLDGDRGAAGILRSTDYKGVVIESESPHYFMDADTREDFSEIVNQWGRMNS